MLWKKRRTEPRMLVWTLMLAPILAILVYLACCLAVSIRYGRPIGETANKIARFGFLTAVRAGVGIHDPAPPRSAKLGPGADPVDGSYAGFQRAEKRLQELSSRSMIHVGRLKNERILRSDHPFGYQPYDEPRIQELRRRYRLDDVVAGAANDFEALVKLRDWSRSRFRRRDYQPLMTDFDALLILDRDLRNDEDLPYDAARHIDPCSFFPLLYAQLAVSLGHQARLVHISHDGYDFHGMAEVWSNHLEKWIAMDGELALHYELEGVPLNLLEVHEQRDSESPAELTILRGVQSSGDESTTLAFLGVEELDPAWMVSYHSYLCIVDMRNDWMTNHYFRAHPRRSDAASLCLVDERMPRVFDLRPHTTSKTDFYWTLNQTEIWIGEDASPPVLQLAFRTFTPNFERFDVRVCYRAPQLT